jgi:hypothetical protein
MCYHVVYYFCETRFYVVYNVIVLSCSLLNYCNNCVCDLYCKSVIFIVVCWFCSPYNRFINVYMIIYIWKGSISVNIKVVSWMGIHHFHRKQVYTFNVFAIHLITLSKPSTQILTKAISSIVRLQVIQVFSIIVITRYR